MTGKYARLTLFTVMLLSSASAKSIVDCRVVTSGISQCDPYSSKFLIAKEIEYKKDQKKLIVSKTLPVPKKSTVKVISVIDMIEKYVKIEKPIRYEGSKERQLEALHIESPADRKDISLAEETDRRREATMKKLQQMEDEAYSKYLAVEILAEKKAEEEITVPQIAETEVEAPVIVKAEGFYTVEKGDTLSSVAGKFCMSSEALRKQNNMGERDVLKVGEKLSIPLEQNMVDIIAKAEYIIQPGDNISTIAQEFNLSSRDILKYNKLKRSSTICMGKKLILPFPYKIAVLEKRLKKEKAEARKSRGFGKRKLRVTATAYSSHRGQTDKTPFLAAWNNRIRPGMKIIAVSRDMLTRYGLRNGSKVRIGGLRGLYTVRDKMNKRYKKRIDIYMGVNRRKALRWGRRSVVIYF